MIGFLFFGILFGYIILAKFIINKVYKKYGTQKAKNIALAIMILIPTWDVILGYPVYAYLCLFESGTKIYKTVDNVEGYYIGKYEVDDNPVNPIKPYEGYKYIDYQETKNKKATGKYFRNYWLDNNTSTLCIHPNFKYPNSAYSHKFRSGKCIAKEEISKNMLSRWKLGWANEKFKINILGIVLIKGNVIKDTKTNSVLAEDYKVQWSGGWINSLISGIHNNRLKFTNTSVSCNFRNIGTSIINQTLKIKIEER